MKKTAAFLVAAVLGTAVIFAQNALEETSETYTETTVQKISIEDKYGDLHPKAKNVTITLEYTELTGEVRFYYTCMASSFDQGEAMNTAISVFEDFAKEHKYRNYQYRAKDKTKYFKDGRGVRFATYESFVIFTGRTRAFGIPDYDIETR
ncbi:MAG: hypothetical protein J1F14_03740 [Treponema sp.]|nr:hypothetical protein [Treponema sp.]